MVTTVPAFGDMFFVTCTKHVLGASNDHRRNFNVGTLHGGGQRFKGTNPALKKPSNIPEIYAKMFGRFH